MSSNQYLKSIPGFGPLFEGADHMDIKTIEGEVDLRHFLAGLFNYSPGWLKFLYTIRAGFVRLFGMRQEENQFSDISPEDISFTPGEPCAFFTVTHGKDNEYLAAKIQDKHLDAHLLIAAVPLPSGGNRFHVGTIVHYNHWTGPVYFTVIKPFHHLVVRLMMRAGVKNRQPPSINRCILD